MGEVIQKQSFETHRRHVELEKIVLEKEKEIKPGYRSQINLFIKYCVETD